MSALSPRSGIQVSSVYPTYTHIKGQSPVCVCMCVYACVCMHTCVCVCSQASHSRATLTLVFFPFLSFVESFVVEQQTLFRVYLIHISMISDFKVQC